MTIVEGEIASYAMKDLNILRMADDIRQDKVRMDAVRSILKYQLDDLAKMSVLLGQKPDEDKGV